MEELFGWNGRPDGSCHSVILLLEFAQSYSVQWITVQARTALVVHEHAVRTFPCGHLSDVLVSKGEAEGWLGGSVLLHA